MTPEELAAENIESLPMNLYEAIKELQKDEVVKSALGDHIYNRFVEAKLIEWDRYRVQVHPWELEEYLEKF